MKRFIVATMVIASACGTAADEPNGLQPQGHFEDALLNTSTSPSFVRIGLVNGSEANITCVYASRLLMALTVERDPDAQNVSRAAFYEAVSQKSHRFTLRRPEARNELGLEGDVEARSKACRLIEKGKRAMRADYTGKVVEGASKAN